MKKNKRIKKAFWGIVGAVCVIIPCLILPVSASASDYRELYRYNFAFDAINVYGTSESSGVSYCVDISSHTPIMTKGQTTTPIYTENERVTNTNIMNITENSTFYMSYVESGETIDIYEITQTEKVHTYDTSYEEIQKAVIYSDYHIITEDNHSYSISPTRFYYDSNDNYIGTHTITSCLLSYDAIVYIPQDAIIAGQAIVELNAIKVHVEEYIESDGSPENLYNVDYWDDILIFPSGGESEGTLTYTIGEWVMSEELNPYFPRMMITDINMTFTYTNDSDAVWFGYTQYSLIEAYGANINGRIENSGLEVYMNSFVYNLPNTTIEPPSGGEFPDMFTWIFDTLDGVLSLELINTITIGGILWFVIGLSLFFMFLKIYAGG